MNSATDVRALLCADHQHVLRVARRLSVAADSGERRALLSLLEPAVLVHARAEEAAVYAPLAERRQVDSPAAPEGPVEHDLVATLLRELALCRRTDGAEWTAAATVMTELLGQHIDDEQRTLLPALGRAFSAEDLRALGGHFLRTKRRLLERGVSARRPLRGAAQAATVALA